jgi:hypothetical protein
MEREIHPPKEREIHLPKEREIHLEQVANFTGLYTSKKPDSLRGPAFVPPLFAGMG